MAKTMELGPADVLSLLQPDAPPANEGIRMAGVSLPRKTTGFCDCGGSGCEDCIPEMNEVSNHEQFGGGIGGR